MTQMTNELQKMQVLLYHMEDTDVNINAIVKDDTCGLPRRRCQNCLMLQLKQ